MATTAPVFFNAEQVRSVLSWPMVNEAVEEALKSVIRTEEDVATSDEDSDGSFACQPARVLTTLGDRTRLLFTMPGYVANYNLSNAADDGLRSRHNTLACKLVTSFTANEQRQPAMPNIQANIALFSAETGQLQCLMEATQITAWRTAAASVVATKYLYHRRFGADPSSDQRPIQVAIIGCGVQGESHALGMCATFPVSHLYLWNRTSSKAFALHERLKASVSEQTKIQVVTTAAQAVAQADVICVATFAPHALIHRADIKKPSVHINAVGAGQVHYGEVAQDIYDVAKVYVDNWTSAETELKGLEANMVGSIAEIIIASAYPPAEGITVFQSMGMAAEDATVAQAVFNALKRTG